MSVRVKLAKFWKGKMLVVQNAHWDFVAEQRARPVMIPSQNDQHIEDYAPTQHQLRKTALTLF